LRVAVTGHRLNQLPEAHRSGVQSALGAAIDAVADAAEEAGHRFRRLTLVSALAEGADRFAAHEALARRWRLEAPMPYLQARYERDFETEESKAEFRALLGKAVRVDWIDGEALDQVRGDYSGYAAVGEALVAAGDVMIAVWNGAPPKGPGGTAEVCARALAKGAPLIWIRHDAAGGARLISWDRPAHFASFRWRLSRALAAKLEVAPRPPEMRMA
jgi:hypothetical protein